MTHAAFPIEQTFKHYEIRAALGEGGFGQVFEAWDSKLCRNVALKRLKHGTSPSGSASLANEARLAASVQHAAFVKIYAIEDDDDSQSIVMELVRGKTLKQLLAAGPTTPGAAQDIVVQIAQAMQEAHQLGLVHGDLKPSNVMQDAAGSIRILDFGLASRGGAAVTTSLAQSDPQGTIAYMAPEMLTGTRSSVDTDVYALGVMLYELLMGARPFAALHGLALAAALVQCTSLQWDYPDGMAPSLRQLILAMTARDPAQRLPDMQAVLAALGAASRLGGTTPRARRWAAPRRWIAALLALPLAAVLLIGAWHWRSNGFSVPLSLGSYSASQEIAQGLDALRLYDRPGKLADASEHFEHVLARDPNSAAAVAGMSILYSRRHQSDGQDEVWLGKAVAGAQQALKLNDQLALAHAAYGIALERDGKSEPALAALAQALALDPNNVFALLGKVKALIRLRRYDEARAGAERGLALYPQERSFADLIGQAHFEQGDYGAAEQAFRLSLRLQPDAVFAYANLSATLHRQGRSDEAFQILQQGLQVRPNAWLYGNLGTALFASGDYPGAAAAFENAVSPQKGNPGNYLGWANLADTLLWIPGRTGEATQAYAKARQLLVPRLERAPDDVLLVSRMGLYVARGGDRTGAQTLMERALRLAPKSMDVHFRAGMAFELTGNRGRAIEEILLARKFGYPDKAIDSEPDLVDLRRDPRYPQR
ncbi:MAG: serine/threonine-protein kinase [Massilia sp.]|nr:serine/threonine-protein kinase [Massilia sp.]